jgi:ectoine hydroxylase-related dioxygenase (phytanoyl-CoA dioxygenase family)
MTSRPVADMPCLDAPYALTAEQVAAFQRDGHTVLRGVCSPEEVAAYRSVILEAALRFNRETRPLEERDDYGKAFLQIINLWRKDDAVRRFTLAPRFARLAAQLLGVPAVRLVHDQALLKEPGGGPTVWHQDQHYWPLNTSNALTMWMALSPIPVEMGSMSFVSGSHQFGYLGYSPVTAETDAIMRRRITDENLLVVTHGAMQPGDVTFHYGNTWHSAPGNPTDRMREVMTVIYVEDGAYVTEPAHEHQENTLKGSLFSGAKPGDRFGGEMNPVVWSENAPVD